MWLLLSLALEPTNETLKLWFFIQTFKRRGSNRGDFHTKRNITRKIKSTEQIGMPQ